MLSIRILGTHFPMQPQFHVRQLVLLYPHIHSQAKDRRWCGIRMSLCPHTNTKQQTQPKTKTSTHRKKARREERRVAVHLFLHAYAHRHTHTHIQHTHTNKAKSEKRKTARAKKSAWYTETSQSYAHHTHTHMYSTHEAQTHIQKHTRHQGIYIYIPCVSVFNFLAISMISSIFCLF